jgi:hypothetical protein
MGGSDSEALEALRWRRRQIGLWESEGRWWDAAEAHTDVAKELENLGDAGVHLLPVTLYQRARAFWESGADREALAQFEELVARFGARELSDRNSARAVCLAWAGIARLRYGQDELQPAVAATDHVADWYRSTGAAVDVVLANGLLVKSLCLDRLDRLELQRETLNSLIELTSDSQTASLRGYLAVGMYQLVAVHLNLNPQMGPAVSVFLLDLVV